MLLATVSYASPATQSAVLSPLQRESASTVKVARLTRDQVAALRSSKLNLFLRNYVRISLESMVTNSNHLRCAVIPFFLYSERNGVGVSGREEWGGMQELCGRVKPRRQVEGVTFQFRFLVSTSSSYSRSRLYLAGVIAPLVYELTHATAEVHAVFSEALNLRIFIPFLAQKLILRETNKVQPDGQSHGLGAENKTAKNE